MARFGRLSEVGMAAYYVPWDELRHQGIKEGIEQKKKNQAYQLSNHVIDLLWARMCPVRFFPSCVSPCDRGDPDCGCGLAYLR